MPVTARKRTTAIWKRRTSRLLSSTTTPTKSNAPDTNLTPFIPTAFTITKKRIITSARWGIYLLYKKESMWTDSQRLRAKILFREYPDIRKAYHMAMNLRLIFHQCKQKDIALTRLARWYGMVDRSGFQSFGRVARSIQMHYLNIINFFDWRSTNAASESFNAKIKQLRTLFRGVKDRAFSFSGSLLFLLKSSLPSDFYVAPPNCPISYHEDNKRKAEGDCSLSASVPRAGIEPAWRLIHWCLRPARLPIPPSGQKDDAKVGIYFESAKHS